MSRPPRRRYGIRAVSERAKLSRPTHRSDSLVLLLSAVVTAAACDRAESHFIPNYDPQSRLLVRLDADLNQDGRIDQRTYLSGNVPFRTEIDGDEDGRVERWEYFDGPTLTRVGTSSASDGVEDTWTWAVDPRGERRVDLSRRRDRAIDRREFYRDDVLLRAEEDSNADGAADKWETYEAGTLASVALDTTRAAGRPDRRLHYDQKGRFLFLETDPDGDGQWERVTSPVAHSPRER